MADETPSTLQLRVAPPSAQRRRTVLVRLLLALPSLIVVGLVGYAVVFAAFLGWFAALFSGRNPFHKFIVGYIRWYARVLGYLYFLTDAYPPFSFEPVEDYPVDVELVQTPLRRVTVFFRIFLALPVALVAAIVEAGLGILGVVAWLVTLLRGSLPEPLHNSFHATLRFILRTQAYVLLVQERYPSGLFGDPDLTTADESPVAVTVTDTDGTPGAAISSSLDPDATPTRFMGTLPKAPALRDDGTTTRSSWPFALTRGGRRVLIIDLMLGVLAYTGYAIVFVALASSLSSGRVWNDQYGAGVTSLRLVVANAQADLTATSPDWGAIGRDCTNIEQALTRLATVPQYPKAGPNRLLLKGISFIELGDRVCITSIVPRHQDNVLADLARVFSSGNDELTQFEHALP